jgi:catechol 2,3-dioxygenase-like lactoylglutathione lyase family enzyme
MSCWLLAIVAVAVPCGSVAQTNVAVPAPVIVDPATVTPGSKAVARRVTFVVADLARSKQFYEALGFKEDRRVEVTDVESLKVFGLPAGTRLTFVRMTSDNTLSTGRIDGGTIGLAHVTNRKLRRLSHRTRGDTLIGTPILIMTTDGIDAVRSRLEALGVVAVEPPMEMGSGLRSMVVRDPDGTRMEITQPPAPPR